MRIGWFFIVVLLVLFRTGEVRAADEAQHIFRKYGGAIYQVQVIDLATGRKSGIGSGFQFTGDGLIASNYHVVSEALRHPEDNRLEYVQGEGTKGALEVLSVDVLHDLAILKMDRPGKTFLKTGTSDLPKGTRIFSLGNPHDIGFTIVEGTYNGYSRESFIDKILFSGSLNPGMSGGPALSHDGRVVGVNVSTAGNQISFLVPVEPLTELAGAGAAQKGKKDFLARAREQIGTQLLTGQGRVVDALLKKEWESVPFGPFRVPGRIHDALKCWGMPMHQEKDPFRYHRSVCATQDRVFLGEDFDTGIIGYRYDRLTGRKKMDAVRFNAFYAQQYAAEQGDNTPEDDVTGYDCSTSFVDVAARRWKASFCVRRYRDWPAVYDMQLFMALVDGAKEGMIASLWALGVSKEGALALAKRFMGEIRERPAEKKRKEAHETRP